MTFAAAERAYYEPPDQIDCACDRGGDDCTCEQDAEDAREDYLIDQEQMRREDEALMGTVNVDLFAGPGGWDEGLALLGRSDVVGLEWDAAACKTAKAAGHARIRCDVTTYPTDAFGRVEGLIGSPSCTLFSAAGNGVGNLVTHILASGIVRMMRGDDCRVEIRAAIYPTTLAMREAANAKRKPEKRWTQERVESQARDDTFVACLVLEPARYILALGVEWVALEQVPEVLPLWQVYVRELRRLGYSAWTGVLNSADYGVPQTRERAILMAHKSMVVQPPEPTHAERPQGTDLFGGQLEKWVNMATALGWNDDDRVIHPRGAGMTARHGARDDRMGSEPAMTVTSKGRSWERYIGGGKNWIRLGTQDGATVRPISEPAPTVLFGHASNDVRWHDDKPMTRAECELSLIHI